MNITKNRYLYFLISMLVIIPGSVFMLLHWTSTGEGPFALGIDFKGGSLLEVQFAGTRPSVEEINTLYTQFSTADQTITDPVIQPLGTDSYSIRSKQMTDETKGKLVSEMQSKFGQVTVLNFSSVSASIGAEVTRAAGIAILLAALAIIVYIWWAFRSVDHPIRYGTAAIIAMLHDVAAKRAVMAVCFGKDSTVDGCATERYPPAKEG